MGVAADVSLDVRESAPSRRKYEGLSHAATTELQRRPTAASIRQLQSAVHMSCLTCTEERWTVRIVNRLLGRWWLVVALVALAGGVVAVSGADAQETTVPAPVSPAIIATLNFGGPQVLPAASGAMPGVSASHAIADAVTDAPGGSGSATGI
jgi:hypothetical protein